MIETVTEPDVRFVSTPANEMVSGGTGNDTFIFAEGFGSDTIGAYHYDITAADGWFVNGLTSGDVIRFAADIDPAEVTTRLDVVVRQDPRGHYITRTDLLVEVGGSTLRIIEFDRADDVRFLYADGTLEHYGAAGGILTFDGGANDTLYGTSAVDRFASRATSDVLQGLGGSDVYDFVGGFGDDTINDPAYVFSADGVYEVPVLPIGPNRLRFGPGIDRGDLVFTWVDRDLVITVGASSVTIDQWTYRDMANRTVVSFADGSSFDLEADTDAWFFTKLGSAGDDDLFGNGRDFINGLAGNDSVRGFSGADTLLGGRGDDTVLAGYVTNPLGDGRATLNGGDGNDILRGGALAIGGAGNDTLGGAAEAQGNLGHDVISGAARALGGDGNDTIYASVAVYGEGGNDVLAGGRQSFGGEGDDSIAGSSLMDGGYGNDTMRNTGLDSVMRGGPGDDRILGNAAFDNVDAGEGADRVDGGAGDDRVLGGGGIDSIYAGVGDDTLAGESGNDLLAGGDGDDNLFGADGNDVLRGEAGRDSLFGGAGNDNLDGGTGGDPDHLSGGTGADRLRFAVDFGVDLVADFQDSLDRIDLSWFRAINRNAPLGLDDLRIRASGANTFVELDLDRDGTADVVDLDRDGVNDVVRVVLANTAPDALQAVDFLF